jgi:hypothetical protein
MSMSCRWIRFSYLRNLAKVSHNFGIGIDHLLLHIQAQLSSHLRRVMDAPEAECL